MRQIKIIILVLFISGCSTQKYHLTTDPEMLNSYQRTNVIGTVYSTRIQNKIISIPTDYASGQVMRHTIDLIQDKKYTQLKKYLATLKEDDIYLPVASGLLKTYKQEYREAILEFRKNKISELQYIVDLLIVDCQYEIALYNSYGFNYYEFLAKYQNILDTYELNDAYKTIINDRIKFVRYKM